jgi:hypothetical protein
VSAAVVAELFLLDPAAGVLHRFQPEPDHVEGVEDGDRVGELVVDGVGVAAERVQGGDLHAAGEGLATTTKPTGVGGP